MDDDDDDDEEPDDGDDDSDEDGESEDAEDVSEASTDADDDDSESTEDDDSPRGQKRGADVLEDPITVEEWSARLAGASKFDYVAVLKWATELPCSVGMDMLTMVGAIVLFANAMGTVETAHWGWTTGSAIVNKWSTMLGDKPYSDGALQDFVISGCCLTWMLKVLRSISNDEETEADSGDQFNSFTKLLQRMVKSDQDGDEAVSNSVDIEKKAKALGWESHFPISMLPNASSMKVYMTGAREELKLNHLWAGNPSVDVEAKFSPPFISKYNATAVQPEKEDFEARLRGALDVEKPNDGKMKHGQQHYFSCLLFFVLHMVLAGTIGLPAALAAGLCFLQIWTEENIWVLKYYFETLRADICAVASAGGSRIDIETKLTTLDPVLLSRAKNRSDKERAAIAAKAKKKLPPGKDGKGGRGRDGDWDRGKGGDRGRRGKGGGRDRDYRDYRDDRGRRGGDRDRERGGGDAGRLAIQDRT